MKFGLIGHPIEHSLSPALFRAGYDSRYPYELITGEHFEDSYQKFLNEFDGINVTTPFKEPAYAKADLPSEECRLIKATNLLIKTPEGIRAYNSDFRGIRLWLEEVLESRKSAHDTDTAGRLPSVLIIGCGGAGKAAAAATVSLGMECSLMNRSHEKAEKMAEEFRSEGYDINVEHINMFRNSFRAADIVIYTASAAMEQLEDLRDEDFAPGKVKHIMEANYRNPSFSDRILSRMAAANPMAKYIDGRTWLLYQAVTGYEIFTGERPDLAKMSAVL